MSRATATISVPYFSGKYATEPMRRVPTSRNSARPSGALVYTSRDGNLSPDQYERLKTELEQGFQGAAHAGRPLLLEGGLDWKSMSLSPKDMDFIEAKHAAAHEIALALGVPPSMRSIASR